MMGGRFVLTLLVLIVDGVFGVEVERVTVTVMEGDSVSLNPNLTKKQDDIMRWYYNDTLIAFINGGPSTSCLYDGEGGIFRDRLEVNYETGSLTIKNIRSEHTGRYELEFIKSDGTGTSISLNRTSKCDRTKITRKPINDEDFKKSFWLIVSGLDPSADAVGSGSSEAVSDSGLSAGVVAGIVVALLLVLLV